MTGMTAPPDVAAVSTTDPILVRDPSPRRHIAIMMEKTPDWSLVISVHVRRMALNEYNHCNSRVTCEIHRQNGRDDQADVQEHQDPSRCEHQSSERGEKSSYGKHRVPDSLVVKRPNIGAGGGLDQ
ncbi:MAG: hypothetical protein Q9223_006551 [Gallowayella weberi]